MDRNLEDTIKLVEGIDDKDEQLKAFKKSKDYLPPQGSPEWLADKRGNKEDPKKKPTVGGSEVAILLGTNKYQKLFELADRKMGMSEFTGNIATYWGNVMEDVINMITELILRTKVTETGSIPGLVDEHNSIIQSYSPDGLCVTTIENYGDCLLFGSNETLEFEDQEKIDELINNTKGPKWLVLLEYKCPFRRIPNGIVPDHYLPQPTVGMCTIPIMDIALFVDAMFRKCRISNFGFNGYYDRYFHYLDKKLLKTPIKKPLVCGFIGFYDMSEPFDKDYEPKKPMKPPNNEDKNIIVKSICESIRKEIDRKGSDFYGIIFKLRHIMSFICMANIFLGQLYYEHILFRERLWSKQDEENVIFKVCTSLTSFSAKTQKIIKFIIPDALNVEVRRKRAYDVSKLEFGTDFGHTDNYNPNSKGCTVDQFEEVMKHLVADRFVEKGTRVYYPKNVYYQEQDEEIFGENNNYIDRTRSPYEQSHRWLYENVEQFVEFCTKNNYKPIGILPWKLCKLFTIPVFKQPDYLEKLKPKIIDFTDKVTQLKIDLKKQITKSTTESDKKEIIKNLLQEHFPGRRKITKPSAKRSNNRNSKLTNHNDTTKLQNELTEAFSDLF
jgi:hypothetical protein